jgi:hypothetical protein
MIDALPLLLSDEGYQISRSVRLRGSASAYLNRTLTTPTDPKKWTFSAWVKGSFYNGTGYTHLFGTGAAANDTSSNQFIWGGTASNLAFSLWSINVLITNAVYRDPSAWYHVMLVMDNANATASNRAKIYVNGVEPTYSTDNRSSLSTTTNYAINSAILHTIGRWSYNSFVQPEQFDGYITEVNFIDGQALTPSSFGETNTTTGVWQPNRYNGTYGTNGFYLNFSDNSAATAAAIGKDSSGNGNNFTPNNISVTAGATYDSMLDVPTQWADGGNGRGNYAVLNGASIGADATLSNGNLTIAYGGASTRNATMATFGMSSGKWYWECTVSAGTTAPIMGITNTPSAPSVSNYPGFAANGWGYEASNGNKINNAASVSYGASYTANDVVGVTFDADTRELVFYKNGVSQGVAYTGLAAGEYFPAFGDGSALGTWTGQINFGQRPFAYTPPTGFKALHTGNLPTPTILKGNQYFDIDTYTGNATARSRTGFQFAPDFVWNKRRSISGSHQLYDTVRGAGNYLSSDLTAAEGFSANLLTSFDSSGYSLGTATGINASGETYVSWLWKEGATQGFDIVADTYLSAGTFAHNLGVTPSMIIVKRRTVVDNWFVWHKNLTNLTQGYLVLNSTAAQTTNASLWNGTAPTSSNFSLGGGFASSGNTFVAYLFSEVAGFSKAFSYTGNGSADGPFVFLGFRPRFIMLKRTDATSNWLMIDTERSTYNQTNQVLLPNSSAAEGTGAGYGAYDFLSNGFKPRNVVANETNVSGGTYIGFAWAEVPFKNSLAR